MRRVRNIPRLERRKPRSHKGDYGRVLIIAASPGMTGAGYLAGKAAARTGSGLVTVCCPASLNPILEVKLTTVMTLPLPETSAATISPDAVPALLEKAATATAIAIGPGISTQQQTISFVRSFLEKIDKPTVIDADALNALSGKLEILNRKRAPFILTPHPGEFSRLSNKPIDEIQNRREQVAAEFAQKWHIVLILKGHRTVVTDGDRLYLNETGNPGMASGGTGDVLTGIVVSLLGQGFEPFDAAQLGAFIHGLAGDIAEPELGEAALLATDIIDALPQALKEATCR